jgi:hypothetical protein
MVERGAVGQQDGPLLEEASQVIDKQTKEGSVA